MQSIGQKISVGFKNDVPWYNAYGISGLSFNGSNDIACDFVNNRYIKAGVPVTLSDLNFASTHPDEHLALNASGGYDSFAANVPVRNNLGLQVVPTATNVVLESQDFSKWGIANLTLIAGAANGPLGSNTMTSAEVVLASTPTRLSVSANIATASTMTYSLFIKKGSGATDGNRIFVYDFTLSGMVGDVKINLDTGVLYNQNGGTATVKSYADGSYRVSLTINTTIGNNLGVYAGFIGDSTESVGELVYVSGAQLEAGSFATPPIITIGSAVPRAGNLDVISGLTMNTGVEVGMIIDVQDPGSNYVRSLQVGGDTGITSAYVNGTHRIGLPANHSEASNSLQLAPWTTDIKAFSYSHGLNRLSSQQVGQSRVIDTSVSFPAMNTISFFGNLGNNSANMFGRVKEFYMRTNFTPDTDSDAKMHALMIARAAVYS